jgi:hypothetical protein
MRGQRHAPAAPYSGKDTVTIVQEAGWASGAVWTGAENIAPTGIRSPDRPARRQSLYRLRCPAHCDYVLAQYKVAACDGYSVFFENLSRKFKLR